MLRGAPTRLRLHFHHQRPSTPQFLISRHITSSSLPKPSSSSPSLSPFNSASPFSSSSSSRAKSSNSSKSRHRPRFSRPTILLCLAAPTLAIPVLALTSPDTSDTSGSNKLHFPFSLWPSLEPPSTPTSTTYNQLSHPAPSHPMSSLPPSAFPPGRPENLTKEQEQKLKELWTASLQVFGSAGDLASIPTEPIEGVTTTAEESESQPASEVPSENTSTTSETPKKKKTSSGVRGLLSRKDKKDKADPNGGTQTNPVVSAPAGHTTPIAGSAADTAPNVNIDHADDKYGHGREFRAALASQTPAELREAFWSMTKCDNPDGLLLRFLRARKWDVDKALVMMVATMKWRAKEMDVAGIVRRGELGAIKEGDEGFMKQLRMGKSFLHGADKEGRPICYIRVKLHKAGDQDERSLEAYTIYVMETARLMLRRPVDTACVVFDMTDFGLANMDYTPVKFMIKCFEAHYPESLGICLVHKAPWVFQGIWSIIKGWLDPYVAAKIHFTKTAEDLETFIPKSQIISSLGGDEKWDYTYTEPAENEDAALADIESLKTLESERMKQVESFEELTRKWIKAETGAEESDKLKAERFKASEILEVGYWKLDKYLRGRTIYDRTGVVGPNGELEFYPKSVEAKAAEQEAK